MKESLQPIASIKSDTYTRISLTICTIGIVLLGICSFVYSGIDSITSGF